MRRHGAPDAERDERRSDLGACQGDGPVGLPTCSAYSPKRCRDVDSWVLQGLDEPSPHDEWGPRDPRSPDRAGVPCNRGPANSCRQPMCCAKRKLIARLCLGVIVLILSEARPGSTQTELEHLQQIAPLANRPGRLDPELRNR